MFTDVVLRHLLRRRRAGIVFGGHGVTRKFRSAATEEVHIPFEDFEAIVNLLQRLDFDFLTMEEVTALAARGTKHHKHWVHLSFDDGYQNNCDVIHPFLAERGIPFSVFVSTHYVETGDRFPTFWLRLAEEMGLPLRNAFPDLVLGASPAQAIFDQRLHFGSFDTHLDTVERVKALFSAAQRELLVEYENDRPMSLDALKALARDPRVHIGSHSHHHIIYHDGQDPRVAEQNVAQSVRLLRDEWAVSADPTFCYPNGDWAPQWVTMLRTLGVPAAFTSMTGFVDPDAAPLLMPRFWLSNARRARLVCAMAVAGNKSLYVFGRKPPPKRGAASQ